MKLVTFQANVGRAASSLVHGEERLGVWVNDNIFDLNACYSLYLTGVTREKVREIGEEALLKMEEKTRRELPTCMTNFLRLGDQAMQRAEKVLRRMAKVVSVHEYELKPGVEPADFERALHEAERLGLFDLPGLSEHRFLRGLKGARRGAYAAIWIFQSREAWEKLWGPPEAPYPPSRYPEKWQVWEKQILAPLLTQDPDAIRFTSYNEI